MVDQEAALSKLISEAELKDWNDAIDIRIHLAGRAGRELDADQMGEKRELLKRLAALSPNAALPEVLDILLRSCRQPCGGIRM